MKKSKEIWIYLASILILTLTVVACCENKDTSTPVDNPEITKKVSTSEELIEVEATNR